MNLCRQLHEAYKGKSIIGHLITILTILQGWGKMKRAIIIFNGGTLYPTDKKSICYGKNKLLKPVSNLPQGRPCERDWRSGLLGRGGAQRCEGPARAAFPLHSVLSVLPLESLLSLSSHIPQQQQLPYQILSMAGTQNQW